MSNLQKVKVIAKKCGLTFEPTNSTINGAKLYNFVSASGYIVARNWTVSSAINEHDHGNLIDMLR